MNLLLVSMSGVLASSEGDPQAIIFSADLMLVTAIVFVVLLLVLTKFAWKPIITALDARDQGIADDIDSAKQANEKAQAMLAQYEQKIASAGDEAARVITEAKEEAGRARDRIMAEANDAAAKQRDKAVAEINAAKDLAVRELAEKSVDSAVALAQGMLGKELDRSAHSNLIEESIKRFSQSNQFSQN